MKILLLLVENLQTREKTNQDAFLTRNLVEQHSKDCDPLSPEALHIARADCRKPLRLQAGCGSFALLQLCIPLPVIEIQSCYDYRGLKTLRI